MYHKDLLKVVFKENKYLTHFFILYQQGAQTCFLDLDFILIIHGVWNKILYETTNMEQAYPNGNNKPTSIKKCVVMNV